MIDPKLYEEIKAIVEKHGPMKNSRHSAICPTDPMIFGGFFNSISLSLGNISSGIEPPLIQNAGKAQMDVHLTRNEEIASSMLVAGSDNDKV